jgi:2'-5' RNA ligase
MRLFVALDIDPAIRQRLAEFVNDLRAHVPGVRFVGPQTFHVTLKFIGESSRLDELKSALAAVRGPSVELTFRDCGFFPNPQRPRVFWVGIEAGTELQQLADQIDRALRPLGVASEPGPYKPHLTLARAGSGNPKGRGAGAESGLPSVRQYLIGKTPPEFGRMTAHEFILFQSVLSPQGATYTPLARYPLTQ